MYFKLIVGGLFFFCITLSASDEVVEDIDTCDGRLTYQRAREYFGGEESKVDRDRYTEVFYFWRKMIDEIDGAQFRNSIKMDYMSNLMSLYPDKLEAIHHSKLFLDEVFDNLNYCDLDAMGVNPYPGTQAGYISNLFLFITRGSHKYNAFASMNLFYNKDALVGQRIKFVSVNRSIN